MAYAVKAIKYSRILIIKWRPLKCFVRKYCFAKSALQYDLAMISSKINETESTIKQLPEDQQELIKIKRKYDLSDNIYSTFLQRSEADIVKAANLSDVRFCKGCRRRTYRAQNFC
jgi:hypothetical protein